MRKYFLDNVRYGIVLLVILYHVVYLFNSVGVISNVAIAGIPQLDVVLYILYPWFMVCLFMIAGISARYALKNRTKKEFLKTKLKRVLLPSVAGMFILGWVAGWVTSRYADMFGGNGDTIPGFIKYLIYCLSGIGPLWFLHELMLCFLVLILCIKIDKGDKLSRLGGKTNLTALFLLAVPFWGSAQILNTPYIEIYRNGIYIFSFLLGYYVFYWDNVQKILRRYANAFLAIAAVLAVSYTATYYGENYSEMENLKSPLTNVYAWFASLAVLSFGIRYFDKETKFTVYMRSRSFSFYVLHYPIMVVSAYILDSILNVPVALIYVLLIVIESVLLPVLSYVLKKIPVVRTLLLGE